MVLSLINYEELTYHNGSYQYPVWAQAIGWSITGSTLLCIPGYAIFNFARADGESFTDVRDKATNSSSYNR